MKAHFHNSNNSSMLFISIAATSMLLIIQFTNLTKIFSLYDSVSNIPNLKDRQKMFCVFTQTMYDPRPLLAYKNGPRACC